MKIIPIHVIPPSEKQVAAGIFGTVNIDLVGDGGNSVVRLNGLTVKKNGKTGERFLAEPSNKVGDKWYSHFKLFPSVYDDDEATKAQREKQELFTAEVLRILDAGGTKKTEATASPTPVTATKTDPWLQA